MWKSAIEDAIAKTKRNLEKHPADEFPHITEGNGVNRYRWGANRDWIEGFYAGMVWLAYQYTQDPFFRDAGFKQTDNFRDRLARKDALDHHDIGFLYMPSAVAQWMLEKDDAARRLGLEAADHLCTRWRKSSQLIQAWGPEGDSKNGGRIIIDCLMNLPLLYWASEQTGDSCYKEIAVKQAYKSRRYLVRGDDSSYHTFYFNQQDGTPIGGGTHQGYHDGSTWTRGQAWGIYGFALSYRYTRNPLYLETSLRLARYFIRHLPADHVAYWDFDVEAGDKTYRDSSASAIAACGVLELLLHLESDHPDRPLLERFIHDSMNSLLSNYSTIGEDEAEGLLKHGSYYVRGGAGPDDYMIWGDYYYLEALMRLETGFAGFWYPPSVVETAKRANL